jgi:L-lactate dehydrogenase complex protein LldE
MGNIKASLFVTCLVDNLYPEVGHSTVKILRRLGVDVDFPLDQTCCGQIAYNSGYHDDAKKVAIQTINAFAKSDYVILPSGSCSGMIHHYYPDLFKHDPGWREKAQQLIDKTYELTQFLVHVLKVEDLGAVFPHRVTYHPSCHMSRLLGVKDEPIRLLQRVKALTCVPLNDAEYCCGFGGVFSVKMSDISAAMVDEKANNVRQSGADVLTSADMGCLMNIGGRLKKAGHPMRVMHLAEILAEGMGL